MGALGLAVITSCGSSGPEMSKRTVAAEYRTVEARSLAVAGRTRQYGILVPVNAARRSPMLIVVHLLARKPGQPDLAGVGDATPLYELARDHGLTLASPLGIDFSFNGGTCCGTAAREQVDDAAFLTQLVDDVVTRDNVDPKRVYLVGFSNGGFLAYRMACEHPDLFAGVAVVEGALLVPNCAPAIPTNLLVIHQRGDATVPFAGTAAAIIPGDPVPLPSVADSLDRYLLGTACDGEARRAGPGGQTTTYRCRSKRVRLVAVPGGSHRFPSTADGFDAAGIIGAFFGLDR